LPTVFPLSPPRDFPTKMQKSNIFLWRVPPGTFITMHTHAVLFQCTSLAPQPSLISGLAPHAPLPPPSPLGNSMPFREFLLVIFFLVVGQLLFQYWPSPYRRSGPLCRALLSLVRRFCFLLTVFSGLLYVIVRFPSDEGK